MMSGGAMPLSKLVFKKYDTDGSGKISVKEFRNLCYDKGYVLDGKELETAIQMVDVDGDGEIDYSEFEKWWKNDKRFEKIANLSEEQRAKVEQLTQYFQYFDKDRSAYLDSTEFAELHAHLKSNHYVIPEVAAVFSELDKSKDGKIAFNEFLQWMISMGAV